jgi:hypothetical protein
VVDFEYTYQGEHASVMWADATDEMLQKVNEGILDKQEMTMGKGQEDDVADSIGGISDRTAGAGEQPQDVEILPSDNGRVSGIRRKYFFSGNYSSIMQAILHLFVPEGHSFNNNAELCKGVPGIPFVVFQRGLYIRKHTPAAQTYQGSAQGDRCADG